MPRHRDPELPSASPSVRLLTSHALDIAAQNHARPTIASVTHQPNTVDDRVVSYLMGGSTRHSSPAMRHKGSVPDRGYEWGARRSVTDRTCRTRFAVDR